MAQAIAHLVKASGDKPQQQGAPGATLSEPLKISVTDAEGNGVGNVAIAFSMASQPQRTNASFSSASATTGSDGYASTTLTLGSKPGEYKVTATRYPQQTLFLCLLFPCPHYPLLLPLKDWEGLSLALHFVHLQIP